METIYNYVDESGADSKGKIFVVAVPTFGDNRDELRKVCEQIEQDSGKNKFKWGKARPERRLAYLQAIFADKRFKGCLRYAVFYGKRDYDADTVTAIANAIRFGQTDPDDYIATVYVDALSSAKSNQYTKELRRMGVHVQRVRSVAKDENDALIRLADAVAGFIRDILTDEMDSHGEAQALYQKGKQGDFLIEV